MKEYGKLKESKKSQNKITKYTSYKKKNTVWSDDNRHTHCPYKDSKEIEIPWDIFSKIVLLVKQYSTEWLAYLDYEETEKGFVVKDMIIPEQEVTSSSVTVTNPDIGVGKGVIHYHPFKHGAWHSSTDEEYVNCNHPFSIVVDDNLDFKAKVAIEVPCGCVLTGDGEVNVPLTDEIEKFLENTEQKIKEKQCYKAYTGYGGYSYYYTSKDTKNNKTSKPVKYEDDEIVIDFIDNEKSTDAKCRIFDEKCKWAEDREDAWCVDIGYCIKKGIDITDELLSEKLTKEELNEIKNDIETLKGIGVTKIAPEEVE